MHYSPWFVSGQWIEAPVGPPILGIVIAAVAVVALAAAWWTLIGLGVRRALVPVLGGVAGGAVGAVLAASPVAFAIGEPIRIGDAIPSWWAHALPWEIAAGTAVVGGAVAGAAVAAALIGQTATRAIAIPAVVLGASAGIPPVAWVAWLIAQGPVPLITATVGYAHPGHTVTPTGTIAGDPQHLWSLTLPGAVVAGAPGPIDAPIVAERGPVRTGKACAVEVGRDEVDPRMPLDVGDRWTFDSAVTTHVTMVPLALGVIDLGDSRDSHAMTVYVASATDDGPVHLRHVSVDGETIDVFGWNGTTRAADGTNAFSEGPDGVTSALLPTWRCDYAPATGDRLALAGPSVCHKAPGGLAGLAASAIIGVATVGLIVPDPSPEGTLVATSSGRAP